MAVGDFDDEETPVTVLVTGLTVAEANQRLVALESAHADATQELRRRNAQLVLEVHALRKENTTLRAALARRAK